MRVAVLIMHNREEYRNCILKSPFSPMFAGKKCAFPSGEGGAPQGVTDEEKSEQYIEFQIVFPNVRSDKKSLLLEEKVARVSETDVV